MFPNKPREEMYFCHIRLLKTDVTMTSRYPSSPSDKFDRFVYSDFKYVQSIQYNCTVADHKRPVYRSILWRLLLYNYTYLCHIRFLADVTYTLECPPIYLHLFLSHPFFSRCDIYFGVSSYILTLIFVTSVF